MTQDANYGKQTRVSDFFNGSVNARFASGLRHRRRRRHRPDGQRHAASSSIRPQQLLNCRVVTPFKRADAAQALRQLSVAGRFLGERGVPEPAGPVILANYPAPNGVISPSLGRNLAARRLHATATVPLIEPQTLFEAAADAARPAADQAAEDRARHAAAGQPGRLQCAQRQFDSCRQQYVWHAVAAADVDPRRAAGPGRRSADVLIGFE